MDSVQAASLHLSIGDLVLGIRSRENDLNVSVTGAARRFLVPETAADCDLEVRWSAEGADRGGKLLFDSGGVWQLWELDGRREFRCWSPTYGQIPYKVASFEHDLSRGAIHLHRPYFEPPARVDPLEFPLDELIVTNLLGLRGGIELHACGVVDSEGHGYLFAGHSGAGKTTIGRLFEQYHGVTILSDDRIVVRMTDGAMRMYGTPWHGEGELSAAQSALLSRIFFIHHGSENALEALSPSAAVARLFACSFPPLHDGAALTRTLQFLDELASAVPCGRLSVKPDRSVVDFLAAASR